MGGQSGAILVNPLPLYSLDTHALYWHLVGSGPLSPAVQSDILDAQAGRAILVVSTVVLAELFWLLKNYGREQVFAVLLARLQTTPAFRLDTIMLDETSGNYPTTRKFQRCMIA